MSTTFEVYPADTYIPSFSELLSHTEMALECYLKSIHINKSIRMNAELHLINGHDKKTVQPEDKVVWDETAYAWFFVKDVPGGTDAYYCRHTDLDIGFLKEELAMNDNFRKHSKIIHDNLRVGYHWVFRRSAGQPAIITLSYGFLAAALAKLTNGVIYTDDGAWDYEKFPAGPDDFMSWYFRPEHSANQDDADFTERCIRSIRKMLAD